MCGTAIGCERKRRRSTILAAATKCSIRGILEILCGPADPTHCRYGSWLLQSKCHTASLLESQSGRPRSVSQADSSFHDPMSFPIRVIRGGMTGPGNLKRRWWRDTCTHLLCLGSDPSVSEVQNRLFDVTHGTMSRSLHVRSSIHLGTQPHDPTTDRLEKFERRELHVRWSQHAHETVEQWRRTKSNPMGKTHEAKPLERLHHLGNTSCIVAGGTSYANSPHLGATRLL